MPATQVAARRMGMPEIKVKAKTLGITPGRMKKAELIHSIQLAEGCTPCYGTSTGQCPHSDCCFMDDCFRAKA